MGRKKTLHLHYYAALRETAGLDEETVLSEASTAAELYGEVSRRHGIPFAPSVLSVAVNDRVVPWDTAVNQDDTVVFLAPFAGG